MEELSQVLVFKTNIQAQDKIRILELLKNQNFVLDASIDIEDCDRVLRIVCDESQVAEVIKLVTAEGFNCEELN